MRTIGIVFCVALVILLATRSSSRGDGESEPPPDPDETMPFRGSETPMHSPFSTYSSGPPEATWFLADLGPEEQIAAERGLDSDYTSVNAGYRNAVQQRSAKAKIDAAARKLGVDTLETGVVP